ncbi:hypothetical protein F4561_003738 [Lipingzhangella halophila]|uniref:Uncharacterized protein n=1 Tax=Lipingzhangella halophila TaxID=1783352 RepID=A0A7W7RJT3_9ACTN|nr:hypothetical protein [Lipingzhangella halophila]MBB4932918.1 hypothetical protein [Lipingzhangella halophila]
MRKLHKTLITAAALPLSAALAIIGAAPADAGTTRYSVNPCMDGGPTKEDQAMADRLNGILEADMEGQMDDYRVSCARAVIEAVQERGMDQHAADAAITTAIVETHLQNINIEVDHDSLGLFQQRGHWGSPPDRANAEWATNAFLDEMENLYPDESWKDDPIGEVTQGVQRSAYPDRYGTMVEDAKTIVDELW